MLIQSRACSYTQHGLLRAGAFGLGVSAALPSFLNRVAQDQTQKILDVQEEKYTNRILLVLELTGGNDGLNTVVPYGDDAYYQARPTIGIKPNDVIRLDDHFGLHPAMPGFEALFKDGELAIVHGCGYPEPNLSHFTAMEWWHTAAPHGNELYGWLGRFADENKETPVENYIVNIGARQSRAVASAKQSPIVFSDPKKLGRAGTDAQQKVFELYGCPHETTNSSLDFVNTVSKTATVGAAFVRNACREYRTMVDYGADSNLTLDLKKVTGLIHAGLSTRIYYVNLPGFDTHASQGPTQNLLLIYVADALRGFMEDLKRIGRADDVAIMVFTEFGRRVNENMSGGTDHGTATPMYIVGKKLKGGLYGRPVSLTDLDNGNLKMTTDFRSVYGTMLKEWMGFEDIQRVLKGDFPTLGVFA